MKKTRGARRRVRRLRKLTDKPGPLHLEHLREHHFDYAKSKSINPFASIFHTQFVAPMDIRLTVCQWLVRTYLEWDRQLKDLGEPYYLKIWLDTPTLFDAQVVCAVKDRIQYYETMFSEPLKPVVFPFSGHTQIEAKIQALSWTQKTYPNVVLPSDFEDNPLQYEKLREKALGVHQMSDGGGEYLVLPGRTFWIGERPA